MYKCICTHNHIYSIIMQVYRNKIMLKKKPLKYVLPVEIVSSPVCIPSVNIRNKNIHSVLIYLCQLLLQVHVLYVSVAIHSAGNVVKMNEVESTMLITTLAPQHGRNPQQNQSDTSNSGRTRRHPVSSRGVTSISRGFFLVVKVSRLRLRSLLNPVILMMMDWEHWEKDGVGGDWMCYVVHVCACMFV